MTDDSGRDPTGQALAVPVEPVARLDPTGFDPSRWRVGDILFGEDAVWKVAAPPTDHPAWLMVQRLFKAGEPIMDVPCGHACSSASTLWARFERLLTGPERYAIATEAGTAETSSGSVHESAGLQGIAQPQSVSGLSHTGVDRG